MLKTHQVAWKVGILFVQRAEVQGKSLQVIKQNILCHFKNWRQFCAYTTSVNFSWLLVTTEFKLFPQKKKQNKTKQKTTIQMQQVVLCHLYLMGLQIKQCIFLANIFIHKPLQNVHAV